jgi:hypothetical protein
MALALDLPPLDLPPLDLAPLDLAPLDTDALTYEEEHALFGLPPAVEATASHAGPAGERGLVVEMLLLAALLLGALCAGAVVAAVGIVLTV